MKFDESSVPPGKIIVTPTQKKILSLIRDTQTTLDQVAKVLGAVREDFMRDVKELEEKGLVEVKKSKEILYEITEEGRRYIKLGMPEERILKIVESQGEVKKEDLLSIAEKMSMELTSKEVDVGIMFLARFKAIRVKKIEKEDGSKSEIILSGSESEKEEALKMSKELRAALEKVNQERALRKEIASLLLRRNLVRARSREVILLKLSVKGEKVISSDRLAEASFVTALKPNLIESGEWRKVVLKPYDLSIEPPRVYLGKKHPYLELLDQIREILVSMGFEEMKGPHVELELWNFDALFQPQDHPARDIHDTYFLHFPRYGKFGDSVFMNSIAKVHEDGWETGSKGWCYKWDPRKALKLILRTHTTAVSARTLYERGDGEYMCFALDRVFRPEALDPQHSMEFYQLEGIIVSEKVTFRHLIGFFHDMAKRLGIAPVKIKPAYFPFTEPSVEGFIKHPELGWIEVFPGGMFRPEMLRPLGIRKSNVAAWGIGIDRIAMSVLGIDDIRFLFTQDLDFLRNASRPFTGF